MKHKKIDAYIAFFSVFILLFPTIVSAAPEFNPHLIITDEELVAADTMNAVEIQRFLDTTQSALRTEKFIDTDGVEKTAAQIIFAAAQEAKINPRYILVMLQKEQSLISTSAPKQKQLDWATGFGVCDSCSMDDPSIQKYKGFATQVRSSANVMRYYYANISQGWIKKQDTTYPIDTISVTPKSNATAFLYTYTPHITGNKNFWRIWTQWFTKVYPDGSLLQASGEKTIFLLQNGRLRAFGSKAALASRHNPDLVLKIQPNDLLAYEQGAPIKLPNYTLAKAPSGMIYLLIDDVKHPVASTAVFKTIGFHPSEVEDVTDEDLASYQAGTFLTTASVYPLGTVAQEKKSKAFYYIKNGERNVILSKEVVAINFPKKKIITLDVKQLAKYPLNPRAISFRDGTLLQVKGAPFIYVMSNGTRRLIPSISAFKNLGYQEKNIVLATEAALSSIPEGDGLTDVAARTQVAAR